MFFCSVCDLLNNCVNKYSITTALMAGEQNMSKEHWQGKTEVFPEKPVSAVLCCTWWRFQDHFPELSNCGNSLFEI